MGVFVGSGPKWSAATPCIYGKKIVDQNTKQTEGSFTSVQMVHTHTPGRSRGNPERQEEEKGEHRRRAEGKNSAGGGEQTDLQNQPTRRNGPDQNSAHT